MCENGRRYVCAADYSRASLAAATTTQHMIVCLQVVVFGGACHDDTMHLIVGSSRFATLVTPTCNIHAPALGAPNPVSKLHHIGNRRTQHHNHNMRRKHDDDLLPHHTTLGIVDVVNLVENDILHIANDIRALFFQVGRWVGEYGGWIGRQAGSFSQLQFASLTGDCCPQVMQ